MNAPPPPDECLRRLAKGNNRFRAGRASAFRRSWTGELARRPQRPFAIVLGCSDSRTPVEILFDQGFGDLFVVRVAGNTVAPSIVGSIEFAASQFGTRLVLVMGHSHCGAVEATVRAIETGLGHSSDNIRSITDRIAPHVEPIVRTAPPDRVIAEAVRANVLASMDHLRHGSRIIEDLVVSKALAVAGAICDLETGAVEFLGGVPPARKRASRAPKRSVSPVRKRA